MLQPLLTIEDLEIAFGTGMTPAVSAVDIRVYPQQTVALVGESGCGKSITALSVMRLLPASAVINRGRIQLGERNLLDLSQREMLAVRGGQIAMIFQEPMTCLNPVLTVGDQILEAIQLHQRVKRGAARDLAVQAMRDVGIADAPQRLSAYPHQFSGGMRQRVMIAMALAGKPRLLLADEPTTALDVTIQAQILQLISRLKHERGLGVMLITHDLGIVAQHADVVCVMYGGRIMEYAGVFELFERPLHPYTRALLRCRPSMRRHEARLPTISEFMASASREPVPGSDVLPWWPASAGDETDEYALCEVSASHWVGCRLHAEVRRLSSRKPDLPSRRVEAHAA